MGKAALPNPTDERSAQRVAEAVEAFMMRRGQLKLSAAETMAAAACICKIALLIAPENPYRRKAGLHLIEIVLDSLEEVEAANAGAA